MPKYNIKLPTCIGKFNAENRRDAIDQAIRIWRLLIDKMIADGTIYAIPDICKIAEKRDGMKELGNEVPIKPSRLRGRRKR